MQWIALTLAGFLLAGTSARAAERVTLRYEAETSESTPSTRVSDCPVFLGEMSDARNNRETIGHEFQAIVADGVPAWASASFDRLNAHGFTLLRDGTPPANSIRIKPALIRAYTFHGPMRINGIVAFDTQIILPDGRNEHLKLRAAGSKTNMAGSTGEYVTTLNYAVNNAMDQLASMLTPFCKPTQVTSANN